ncbi:MAG: HAD family hydrolase [Pseudomonadota bacterium]
MVTPHSDLIGDLSAPLEPLATHVEPDLSLLSDIRAVVFDIYGTLLISAAGDISLSEEGSSAAAMESALAAVVPDQIGSVSVWVKGYESGIIAQQQLLRERGIEWPEVDIRVVWRELAESAGLELSLEQLTELAFRYELLSNPTWSMPGAREVIDAIRSSGRILGIVSNAQFYSPCLLSHYLGGELTDLGFSSAWSVYSYENGEGKPSRNLYRKIAAQAEVEGLLPSQILYLGNDVKKDIQPAAEVGFRTGLFAGDRRSLRTYATDPQLSKVSADIRITHWDQIPQVLGL